MAWFLITGGCGFIGSHLADALVRAGHRVRVLDDLSTGHRENLPREAELIHASVTDPTAVRHAMEGVSGCFHLAAIASVARSTEEWPGTHAINAGGTVQVLDAARQQAGGPVPVVYASSAAVYGDNDALPLIEGSELRPLTPYAADKLSSELHARVATLTFGVPTVGLRFFNIYGPRQDPSSPYSGVISIFTDRIRRQQPLTLHGDGSQVRDFVYVEDAVRFLLAAMLLRPATPERFNVCTGHPTAITELAHTLFRVSGTPCPLLHGPSRSGDIARSLGDPGHAQRVLGLTARVTLEQGLASTLEAK